MNKLRTLTVGDWVTIDGDTSKIVAISGTSVKLRSANGRPQVALTSDLLRHGTKAAGPAQASDPDHAEAGTPIDGPNVMPHLDQDAFVDALPADELARVRELERHLREVITGYPDGVPQDDEPPNPAYLPEIDVTTKLKAKLAELAGTPLKCGERTLWTNYKNYRDFGVWGLVSRPSARINRSLALLDPRIREAILEQACIETEESTAGHARFYHRVEQRLADKYGSDAPTLPKDRTFRRRVADLLGKRHPGRPADQRRNLASQPSGIHGHLYAIRPGQIVMMDSNRFDVLAYDPLTDQSLAIELTLAIDLYTRSIVAWRFTPLGANAVDAVMLLADMLTPEAMRPGWAEHLRYSYYGITAERACSLDERLAAAAARPIIWPETLIIDNGKIYVSDALRNGCARYGVNLQYSRSYKATDKPEVERAFGTIGQQFAAHLAGYKGRNVSHRGPDVEATARWTLDEIEDFFAEYVVTIYQRRPHSGLRVPGAPAVAMSPNDMYAEGIAVAGTIPVPADPSPYLELLPIEWRQTHPYGVQIDRLIYDGDALGGLRGVKSPYPGGLWPIRKDPRNRLQVFFKHPDTGVWHALRWIHAENWLQPFTDRTIDYVLNELAGRGRTHPLADEVTAALHDLQRRMDAPEAATAKDRRRLARDRARVQSTLRDQARADFEPAGDEVDLPKLHVVDDGAAGEADTGFDISRLRPFGVYGADEKPGPTHDTDLKGGA